MSVSKLRACSVVPPAQPKSQNLKIVNFLRRLSKLFWLRFDPASDVAPYLIQITSQRLSKPLLTRWKKTLKNGGKIEISKNYLLMRQLHVANLKGGLA